MAALTHFRHCVLSAATVSVFWRRQSGPALEQSSLSISVSRVSYRSNSFWLVFQDSSSCLSDVMSLSDAMSLLSHTESLLSCF